MAEHLARNESDHEISAMNAQLKTAFASENNRLAGELQCAIDAKTAAEQARCAASWPTSHGPSSGVGSAPSSVPPATHQPGPDSATALARDEPFNAQVHEECLLRLSKLVSEARANKDAQEAGRQDEKSTSALFGITGLVDKRGNSGEEVI